MPSSTSLGRELVSKVRTINDGLKARMRALDEVHFRPPNAYNILDCLGSQTYIYTTARNLAKLLVTDNRKYAESVDAVKRLNGLYGEGLTEYSKLQKKLPHTVTSAVSDFLSGAKEYSHVEKVCPQAGFHPVEIIELYDTIGSYSNCRDRTQRLVDALEHARTAYRQANPKLGEAEKKQLQKRLQNAVYSSFYGDEKEYRAHIEAIRKFSKASAR